MNEHFDPTKSALDLILFRALKTYDDQQILTWLVDDSPLLRIAAATELHVRATASNFEAVSKLTKSPRHEHRLAATRVLSQFGTPSCPFAKESFKLLRKLMTDRYFEVRAEAIAAVGQLASLGHQPPIELAEAVIAHAKDGCSTVREAVAYALLSLHSPDSQRTLAVLSQDPDADVREAADFSADARRELSEV